MPRHEFDQGSRYLAKLNPREFLAWRLRVPRERLGFRRWLDTRAVPFPGGTDRFGDTVAELEQPDGEPWAIAVEFQTKPDSMMFARMLNYLAALWTDQKPDPERGSRYSVGAVVVNLTGVGRSSRNMRWPEMGFATELTVVEGNLQHESAVALLDEIASGARSRTLLPWIPLMHGADQSDIVSRWKDLASGEPDDRLRSDYGGLALVFAEAAGRLDLWTKALEGWNVQQSVVVERWRAEGEARGRAEMVIAMLEDRFGTVPAELVAAIRGTTDADRLRQFGRAAALAGSMDEFRPLAGL